MGFGQRLKQARDLRRMTQAQLARLSGSTQPTISALENEMISSLQSDTAAAMAKSLRVDFLWLVTGEGVAEPAPVDALASEILRVVTDLPPD